MEDSKVIEARNLECHNGHFYGIVPNQWAVDENLPKLIETLKEMDEYADFAIWFIPNRPAKANYRIDQMNGSPLVDRVYIGRFSFSQ